MVLILGFGLLILATSLYLAGLWFPAGVCCVVAGWLMSLLLEKMDEVDEEDAVFLDEKRWRHITYAPGESEEDEK